METQKTKTETKAETKAETESFFKSLSAEEKSPATIAKYRRDIAEFRHYLGGSDLCKEAVLRYRDELCARYRVSSVNSILSSLNRYFAFTGRHECRVKTLKMQKNLFASKEKELSPTEYEKLLSAAKGRGDVRLYYLMQTICATGIRVSELCFVTLEAVSAGFADIACKGKRRRIFLPGALCRALSKYARKKKIQSGAIFITRSGKPLDRSNIWSAMKKLCRAAGVAEEKVFPHNLRHLFARTHYSRYKDIVRLADLLGHSSINTTRLYTMENGDVHRRQIEMLGLLRC